MRNSAHVPQADFLVDALSRFKKMIDESIASMSPATIDTDNAPTNHWLKKTGKEAGAQLKFQG